MGTWASRFEAALGLLDELGLEQDGAAVDLAVDFVIARDQANAHNFRADLDRVVRALEREALGEQHRIAVVQHDAVRIADLSEVVGIARAGVPLVSTRSALVITRGRRENVGHRADGAGRGGIHRNGLPVLSGDLVL